MHSIRLSSLNIPQALPGLHQQLVKVTNLRNFRVVEVAPSGTRYDFGPNESLAVRLEDVEYLRQREATSGGCCGTPLRVSKYFEVEA